MSYAHVRDGDSPDDEDDNADEDADNDGGEEMHEGAEDDAAAEGDVSGLGHTGGKSGSGRRPCKNVSPVAHCVCEFVILATIMCGRNWLLSNIKGYTFLKDLDFIHFVPYKLTFSCQDPSSAVPACETIHVCIVATGSDAIRSSITGIKSLLFYRRNPIHFHFVTDERGRRVLGELFRTWRIMQGES